MGRQSCVRNVRNKYQIRSANEPMTIFYKCSKRERESSTGRELYCYLLFLTTECFHTRHFEKSSNPTSGISKKSELYQASKQIYPRSSDTKPFFIFQSLLNKFQAPILTAPCYDFYVTIFCCNCACMFIPWTSILSTPL